MCCFVCIYRFMFILMRFENSEYPRKYRRIFDWSNWGDGKKNWISRGNAGMREKLRRNEDTFNTIDLKDSIRLYVYLSLPFFSFMNCTGEREFFSGFCSRLYIDKYVDARILASDTNLIFENFCLERNRLMAKITKNKKFLKLVKECIHKFLAVFWAILWFFKNYVICKIAKLLETFGKIQTCSLSDSINFSFLVISSVCSYFLTKKILNVFVKML